MAAHTPGPWDVNRTRHGDWDVETDGADIARVYDFGGGASDESNANARLIAAAPDLLEGCRLALGVTHPENALHAFLVATIAKAAQP